MATPKKKHLIELMIEAGVKWPDGAEYAAQDKHDKRLSFYKSKPRIGVGSDWWGITGYIGKSRVDLPSLCRNWHQTIVTREQYAEAVADAAVTTEVQTESEHCESVVSQGAYTINQLADDYYVKAVEADRLQAVADKTLKLANEALITLQEAGERIGLVISVDSTQKHTEHHQQPIIPDWCDLKIGDIVECIKTIHNEVNQGERGIVIGKSRDVIWIDFCK